MSDEFDPYRKWLGIPPEKRPPSHYDLLGVSLDEEDADVIAAAHQQRRTFVESQRGLGQDDAVAGILYQLDEAKVTLLDRELRRDYDRKLKLFGKRKRKRQVDPNATVRGSDGLPPRMGSGGEATGEGTDFLRTYGGIVAILAIAFGAMLWWSFQQPWGEPPEVADAERPNALFDAIADEKEAKDNAAEVADAAELVPPQLANEQAAGKVAPMAPADVEEEATEVGATDAIRPVGRYLIRFKQRPPGTRTGEHSWEFFEDGRAKSKWGSGRLVEEDGQSTIRMQNGAVVTLVSGDADEFAAVFRNENRPNGQPDDVSDWTATRVEGQSTATEPKWTAIQKHRDIVEHLDIAANGKTFVSASADRTVRLWDYQTGQELWKFDLDTESIKKNPLDVRFSVEDGHVLVATSRHVIRLDPEDGSLVTVIGPADRAINWARFSDDGTELLFRKESDYQADLNLCRIVGDELRPLFSVKTEGSFGAIGPNGEIFVGDYGGKINSLLHDRSDGQVKRSWRTIGGRVVAAAYSPSGQYLSIGGVGDNRSTGDPDLFPANVTLRKRAGEWEVFRTLETEESFGAKVVSFSPDERYLAVGGSFTGDDWLGYVHHRRNGLKIVDLEGGEVVETFGPYSGAVLDAAFAADGRHVIIGTADRQIRCLTSIGR